jgi:glyoxylase-like metal-dependent hydrolase (beta-lactamase superfamily II)
VVITVEGAVVIDPINADAAKWIKSEVAKLTKNPVSHLIYSHSHGDHASGASLLAENATVIAHASAPASIDGLVPTLRFDETHELNIGSKTFELTWVGPGHGKDLIAVAVRPENVAFITDAVSPKRLP